MRALATSLVVGAAAAAVAASGAPEGGSTVTSTTALVVLDVTGKSVGLRLNAAPSAFAILAVGPF